MRRIFSDDEMLLPENPKVTSSKVISSADESQSETVKLSYLPAAGRQNSKSRAENFVPPGRLGKRKFALEFRELLT